MSNASSYVCEIIEKIAALLKGNANLSDFAKKFFSI